MSLGWLAPFSTFSATRHRVFYILVLLKKSKAFLIISIEMENDVHQVNNSKHTQLSQLAHARWRVVSVETI